MDIQAFYEKYHCTHIYNHCYHVALKARELALMFDLDDLVEDVYLAGLLHDLGGIYPTDQRVDQALAFNIDLCDEEYAFPLIIHQKLSKVLASKYFHITNDSILSSIECHTTLKKDYTDVDLIVFLADKIAWDQVGVPPYLDGLQEQLNHSLEHAALYYINYILEKGVKVKHPWLIQAKDALDRALR